MLRTLILVSVFALVACAEEPPPAEEQEAERDHVLKDQFEAKDRAEQLQDDLNQQVKDRLDEIDEQSRPQDDDG